MRSMIWALVALAILPWQSANATPGVITRPDPQLLQTYWSSLAVRDGIRERDEVRIERNGQTVANALVVCVTADHSSLMLTGSHPNVPQAGDSVILVKQAAALPATQAATSGQVAYKVVGGHSMLAFNPQSFSASGFGGGDVGGGGFSIGSGFAVSSGTVTSSGFSVGSNFSVGGDVSVQPGSFNSGFSCSSGFSVGGGLGF